MAITAEAKVQTIVRPFGIEADTPRNSDVIIQCIPGCRLRGAVAAGKMTTDAKTGEKRMPTDETRHLGMLPLIPGMQIHVNPAKSTYTIIDPLHDDEELCRKITRAMREDGRPMAVDEKSGIGVKGVPPQNGKLDPHRMKSLCREILWLLESEHAKMIKGPDPTLENIDALPGHYLTNPGSRVQNTQPRFEKDWSKWYEQLVMSGG